jgi:pimeloyl-ACP methyl ester carboxylesterase
MKPFYILFAIMLVTSYSVTGQSSAQEHTLYTKSPDGIPIAYEVIGEGKTALVFVHGWSCDRSYWKGQLGAFSQQFKVIAIDLAGHGESGLGRSSWTMAAFGGDVAAVVQKLDLKHVILIGHSMGGDVIAEAALQLPGKVLGIVMVDTYKKLGPGRSPEQVQSIMTRFRTDFQDTTRAFVRSMFVPASDSLLVEKVAADMSSAPPDVALGALENALNYSREMPHSLEKLKLPVITINPDNSPTDTASLKHYGVTVMIMPGVGHFCMMENPVEFNHMLSMAIEKIMR